MGFKLQISNTIIDHSDHCTTTIAPFYNFHGFYLQEALPTSKGYTLVSLLVTYSVAAVLHLHLHSATQKCHSRELGFFSLSRFILSLLLLLLLMRALG